MARWYAHLAGFLLALLLLIAACLPVAPGEQSYLLAAAHLRAELRYDLAIAQYAGASAVAPADPLPYCRVGDVRMLQQEWSAARAAYARCASLGPDQGDAWRSLGDADHAGGDNNAALADWGRAAALGDQEALRRLAQAAEARGDVPAAVAFWRRLPAHDPQALAHLGMLALWQGDAGAAQADFLAAGAHANPAADQLASDGFLLLAALPQNAATTQSRLGHAFLAANLPALALAPFARAIALAPASGAANDTGETHAYLGWTLLLLGQSARAAQEIATGLAQAPDSSFAWFAAGELALAKQQPALAVQRLQQGALLDPNNPLFWSEISRASLSLHDYLGAEAAMTTASALSTRPVETIALVHIYVDFHLGFGDGSALRAGIAAVTRWPGNEPLEFLLAQIYTGLNEPANAYYALQAAQALDRTDPGPYVLLGAQAENEGNYVSAALDLRTALALRPHGPFAAQAQTLLAPIQDIPV
jgi:tetratricopeptide (TPR) repeat protein